MTEISHMDIDNAGSFTMVPSKVLEDNDENVDAFKNEYCQITRYAFLNITNPSIKLTNISVSYFPIGAELNNIVSFAANSSEILVYILFNFPVNKITSAFLIITFNYTAPVSFEVISNFNCQEAPKELQVGIVGGSWDNYYFNNYVSPYFSIMIGNIKSNSIPFFLTTTTTTTTSQNFTLLMLRNGGSNKYYNIQINYVSDTDITTLPQSISVNLSSLGVPTPSIFSINLPKYNYDSNLIEIKTSNAFKSNGYYSTIVEVLNPLMYPKITLYQKTSIKRYGFLLAGEGTIKNTIYYFSGPGGFENENISSIIALDSNGVSGPLKKISIGVGVTNSSPTTSSNNAFFRKMMDNGDLFYTAELSVNGTSPDTLLYGEVYFSFKYPFGITTRFKNSPFFQKSIIYLVNDQFAKNLRIDNSLATFINSSSSTPQQDTKGPELISFSVSTYNGPSKVIRAHIRDISGFNYLFFNSIKMTSSNLVQGNLFDGIYEMVYRAFGNDANYDYSSDAFISLYDSFLNKVDHYLVYGKIYPTLNYLVPPVSPIFNEFNFTTYYFDISSSTTIDTTNVETKITLYFNTTHPLIQATPSISMEKLYYSFRGSSVTFQRMGKYFYPGYWNKTISMYQIDFKIPRNQFPTSSLLYSFVFGSNIIIQSEAIENLFPTNASISVTSSYADTIGPLVSLVGCLPSRDVTIGPTDSTTDISWRFRFKDYNGVKNGTIVLKSREYYYEQTFKFDKSNIVDGEYKITIPIKSTCTTQTYTISRIALVDEGGYRSDSDPVRYNNEHIHPFISFNETSNFDIKINCNRDSENDYIGPILNDFEYNPTTIDAGLQNKTVNVLFSVADYHGVNIGVLPFVYFSTFGSDTIQVECTFINSSINSGGDNVVFYKVSIDLPYGFGYPHGILISIYGLHDVWGNVRGYASDLISQIKRTKLKIDVPSMTLNAPYINSVSSINTWGGVLSISGNGFGAAGIDSIIEVDYLDGLGFRELVHQFNSGILKVVNIKPTDYSFYIRIFNTASQIRSPVFLVRPIGEKERPLPTPPPTNPPPTCKGNCGGSSQGICSKEGTCTCYSPWVGLDCSSKIIIISPPKIDETKPVINLTLPNESGNGDPTSSSSPSKPTDEIITSLINVVSLRELDINNGLVFEHKFEKWIFNDKTQTNSVNLEYLYTGNISITSKDNPDIINSCTVDVSVQWFKEKTEVTFANSTFTIEPSSIKYNINISSYPFASKLNTLQLVMLVSIQSSKTNDICSNKEFDVADVNNQYLKLTVNQKSIYGLFINRGIIDTRIVSIKNTILDNSDTSFQQELVEDARTSQSYIGVNIPYFSGLACLDPSFSVLVDSQSTESKSNSICSLSTSSNSGLTSAKIAGIVVGSVVGCAILITFIIVYLKSSKGRIALKSFKLKRLSKHLNK